ncbi:methyltransferase domain-containing protein [Candidatus Bathyarchaeota archaeon]|jgi:SAM-dependent methyltransferase|nr:methyltransferase domain-containing protein [Candidatus Bathyarchaeota archaeon]
MSHYPKEPDDFAERFSGWHYSLGFGDGTESVAPYVPSPIDVVKEMLTLSEAGPGDTLYDLGCGDGRILLTAIKDFNVDKAVGFDLNTRMVEATRTKILEEELDDRIKVFNDNFFKADLTPATIVTLYLTTSGNAKLRPKFKEELMTGTRIVSHDFPITDWSTANPEGGAYSIGNHKIFLYKIPESYLIIPEKEEDRWSRIRGLLGRLDRG